MLAVSHQTHLSCDPLLQAFFANPQLPGADVHDTVHLQDLPPQAQRAVSAYMDDPGDADDAPEWTEEDVVHLHWRLLLELRRLPDPETPLEETARAMDDLVRQGKVLYWGTSCWSPRSLKKAHKLADQRNLDGPRVEQPMFNLLDRGIEKDVVPTAARLGMGLVVWSPLAGGILTGKYNEGVPKDSRATTTKWLDGRLTEETLGRVRRFCKIADELEVRPEQLAVAWILRRPEITSVITGATDPEHVKRNVAAAELEIPAGKVAEIEALFPG